MPALKIVVTTAGRTALRNAAANGTNAVVIAAVGVTATSFTAQTSTSVIPDEIKRLASIAGGATAADTIHVTISDNGSDSYAVRGLGLYLADGTLFGSFSQDTDLLQKSAQATMLLACDVQFADIDATTLTFGDTDFQLNQATTEKSGLVELATDAEAIIGADAQRALVPKSLRAVLDDRFGAGAPSTFVKSLLTKASALLFVTALGIRGAASYDTGSGNGLDADKLDGQEGSYYRDYGQLLNVPDDFKPSDHQHSAADITSGTLPVARGGTGAGTLAAGSYLLGNGTAALQGKTPAEVLADIGAAAKVHTHEIAGVIGLVDALAALAPKSSPTLTGSPTAPTPATNDNSARLATTAMVQARIAEILNNSPAALDTLKELADALGDDPNFATTVTNALAGKLAKSGDTASGLMTLARGLEALGTTGAGGDIISLGATGRLGEANMYGFGTEPNCLYARSSQMHRWYVGGLADGGASSIMQLDANGLSLKVPLSTPWLNAGGITSSGGITTTANAAYITTAQYFVLNNGNGVIGLGNGISGNLLFRPNGYNSGTNQMVLSSSGTLSLAALAASGAITGSTVRATGTVMAAGGFQVG